jgi:hypothetical protein
LEQASPDFLRMLQHAAREHCHHVTTVFFCVIPALAACLQDITFALHKANGSILVTANATVWVLQCMVSGGGKTALTKWLKHALTYNEAVRTPHAADYQPLTPSHPRHTAFRALLLASVPNLSAPSLSVSTVYLEYLLGTGVSK